MPRVIAFRRLRSAVAVACLASYVVVELFTVSGLVWVSARGDVAHVPRSVPAQDSREASHVIGGRRAVLAMSASVAMLSPQAGRAAESLLPEDKETFFQKFFVNLPEQWKIKIQLQQAIRVRREKVLDAEDKRLGASVNIIRTPLGADRTANMDSREELIQLVGAFDEKRAKDLSKEQVVNILTRSFDTPEARRERQWLDARVLPGSSEYTGPGGQRYVMFQYEVQECTGKVSTYTQPDGTTAEDCDGRLLPWRRHISSATVMPTQYTSMRTTDRNGVPLARQMESLWLLDASVPVNQADRVGPQLEKIANSFTVELPPPAPLDAES
mmetsp:Transcript_88113/g.189157  ORF Transcript_88113/g.189157 Transcript_88113/m.189157 type:complete len:327 (+) Transcript_88113:43-1023(+)